MKRIFFKNFTTLCLTRGFGTLAETSALNISSQQWRIQEFCWGGGGFNKFS